MKEIILTGGAFVLITLTIAYINAIRSKPLILFSNFGNQSPKSKYQTNQDNIDLAIQTRDSYLELHEQRKGSRVINPLTKRLKKYTETHPLWMEGLNQKL